MSNPRRIGRLLYRKSRNELNESEEKELTVWRKESPENEQLYWDKMDPEKVRSSMISYYGKRDLIFEKIKKRVPGLTDAKLSNQDFSDLDFSESIQERKFFHMFPISRRATIGVIIVLGFVLYLILRATGCISKSAGDNSDAVYVSPEGVEIVLDDYNRGNLAGKADIDLEKNEIGQYDYYASSRDRDKKLQYTLRSPQKEGFRLILPDSTWIWVNSGTTIKYPVNFSQDSIHINVVGEAYVEGKRDSLHPYIITLPSTVNHQPSTKVIVKASTAHFDVKVYSDSSAMLITAITGNLYIRMDSTAGKPRSELQLFAGQQLEAKDGKINVIQNADVNKVLEKAKWYSGK